MAKVQKASGEKASNRITKPNIQAAREELNHRGTKGLMVPLNSIESMKQTAKQGQCFVRELRSNLFGKYIQAGLLLFIKLNDNIIESGIFYTE